MNVIIKGLDKRFVDSMKRLHGIIDEDEGGTIRATLEDVTIFVGNEYSATLVIRQSAERSVLLHRSQFVEMTIT